MTAMELRCAVAIAISGAPFPSTNSLKKADAALATIRAAFEVPTPEMVRASVQGWLDTGLMSGAIREAARVALDSNTSAAGAVGGA